MLNLFIYTTKSSKKVFNLITNYNNTSVNDYANLDSLSKNLFDDNYPINAEHIKPDELLNQLNYLNYEFEYEALYINNKKVDLKRFLKTVVDSIEPDELIDFAINNHNFKIDSLESYILDKPLTKPVSIESFDVKQYTYEFEYKNDSINFPKYSFIMTDDDPLNIESFIKSLQINTMYALKQNDFIITRHNTSQLIPYLKRHNAIISTTYNYYIKDSKYRKKSMNDFLNAGQSINYDDYKRYCDYLILKEIDKRDLKQQFFNNMLLQALKG